MKIKSLIILSLASIWITNCSQPPKDVTEEIVAANKVFIELFNAHKGTEIGNLYTEGGRLFPVNSPVIEGQEAIGQFWSAVFDMGIDNGVLTTVEVESFGDTAVEEGAYSLFDSNNNKLDEGKYIIVWKNVDGQWRLDRDIFSTNMPAPQPAQEEAPAEDNSETEN
ncbi:YybH family protein [Seonamhaeicola maritimus]|uniref:DUF4440 domain-containing protein n=1 Tax=Seonamhaeicola maritimus TaxID=2591822 RepID=A0A5C7GH80_9FLAO|nr:DUF4440 domain-containing protein [Seonamhaeicola maritimus]TXG36749.1 DUF4440 domain-containing protein [Seonamhaeicola maritimus]